MVIMIMGITYVNFQKNIMNNHTEKRILVLGKNGQIGHHLVSLLGDRALAAGRDDIDLQKAGIAAQINAFIGTEAIDAVINAAAYTQVDNAQGDGKQEAFHINAQAVDELAAWCKKQRIPLVHYSTDYVFDGSGSNSRHEDEQTNPVNAYGQSKLDGERAITGYDSKYLIFRTSWVYDSSGKNFFLTMLRLMSERESLNVVSDQVGAPTYAYQCAEATITALDRALELEVFPSGVYHLCNAGQTSWHGFAEAIFMLARQAESREYEDASESEASTVICKQINPIATSAYPTPAKRPLNSRLDTSKIAKVLGVNMPSWEEGLKACFESLYGSSQLQASRVKTHTA